MVRQEDRPARRRAVLLLDSRFERPSRLGTLRLVRVGRHRGRLHGRPSQRAQLCGAPGDSETVADGRAAEAVDVDTALDALAEAEPCAPVDVGPVLHAAHPLTSAGGLVIAVVTDHDEDTLRSVAALRQPGGTGLLLLLQSATFAGPVPPSADSRAEALAGIAAAAGWTNGDPLRHRHRLGLGRPGRLLQCSRRSGTVRPRAGDAGLAALATLVAAWPLSTLLEESSWVQSTLLLVAAVALSGVGARLLGLRGWQVAAAQLVVVVLAAGGLYGRGHLWHGLPTLDTVRAAGTLLGEAVQTIQTHSAPAPTTRGITVLVGCSLALVALLVDYLAVTRRSPSLAGLPLMATFLGAAANSSGTLNPVSSCRPPLPGSCCWRGRAGSSCAGGAPPLPCPSPRCATPRTRTGAPPTPPWRGPSALPPSSPPSPSRSPCRTCLPASCWPASGATTRPRPGTGPWGSPEPRPRRRPHLPMLERYDWPGNVRELRNAVERMAILTPAIELPCHPSRWKCGCRKRRDRRTFTGFATRPSAIASYRRSIGRTGTSRVRRACSASNGPTCTSAFVPLG